jgi:hypothetical protein
MPSNEVASKLRVVARLVMVVGVVSLAACRTPPNVAPFADATDALQVVVSSAGREISAELQQRAAPGGPSAQQWAELQARFDEAWSHRVAAMQAVGDYAAGLVEIVEASRSAESNARQVINQAKTLVSSFSAAFPPGAPAVELLSDALVKGYGAWAEDSAARTIAQAIEYVDPAVSELADILAADLTTLSTLVDDHRRDELLAIDAEYQSNDLRDLAALRSIEQARAKARMALATASDADADELAELSSTLAEWNRIYREEMESPWHADWIARTLAAEEKHDARKKLVLTASATVQAWGEAHQKLARAAATRRTPSFIVLAQLATELLDSYAEMRSHD